MSTVRVGFSVLIAHEKRLLVGKRGSKVSRGVGCVACPGGKVEVGETWAEAVHREVLEETNLHVRLEACSPFRTEVWTSEEVSNGVDEDHYVTIWFLGRLVPGTGTQSRVLEPDKCDWWEWMSLVELVGRAMSVECITSWLRHKDHPELMWLPLNHFIHYRDRIGI
jgi:8-oxo-dGTP diphosphatase